MKYLVCILTSAHTTSTQAVYRSFINQITSTQAVYRSFINQITSTQAVYRSFINQITSTQAVYRSFIDQITRHNSASGFLPHALRFLWYCLTSMSPAVRSEKVASKSPKTILMALRTSLMAVLASIVLVIPLHRQHSRRKTSYRMCPLVDLMSASSISWSCKVCKLFNSLVVVKQLQGSRFIIYHTNIMKYITQATPVSTQNMKTTFL